MNYLICFDDTDNIHTRGTGHLVAEFADMIHANGWGKCSRITRHQLYVNDAVPYTSHNSAMCMNVNTRQEFVQTLLDRAVRYILQEAAEESDPGLCLAPLDTAVDYRRLVDFGKRAKTSVLTKTEAYELASDLNVHLSEHGGTGDGIIGALAGTGLRLSGNDGRFRGWIEMDTKREVVPVDELLAFSEIDAVLPVETDGRHDGSPSRQDLVQLPEKLKTVLKNHCSVLPVKPFSGARPVKWRALEKAEVKLY